MPTIRQIVFGLVVAMGILFPGQVSQSALTIAIELNRVTCHESLEIVWDRGGPMNKKEATNTGTLVRALEWAGSRRGQWHDSGNLNPAVLQAIANHAIVIGASETAETGCGLSTIIMSAIANCHTCFTVETGNSLQRVKGAAHLQHGRVKFVIGPSQLTLPRHSFTRALDFVLIDGPHAFPFPQMEYFYFYQNIREGGVLVVDDIHIPTIRQMYDVLRDDKMWAHIEDVLTTAFFRRTDAPMFDPYGDGWERQQFNQRHFRDDAVLDIHCPGWRESMPPRPGPLLSPVPTAGDDVEGVAVRQAKDTLHGEIDRLRAENAALKASRSWRLTAPLRALSSGWRRRLRNPENTRPPPRLV